MKSETAHRRGLSSLFGVDTTGQGARPGRRHRKIREMFHLTSLVNIDRLIETGRLSFVSPFSEHVLS